MAVFVVGGVALSADQIAWLEPEGVTQTRVQFDGSGWVVVADTIANVQAAWEADISEPSVFTVDGFALNADRITWMEPEGVTQTRVLFGGTGQLIVADTLANVQAAWEAAITPPPDPVVPAPQYARSYGWGPSSGTTLATWGASAPGAGGTASTPALSAGSVLSRSRRITQTSATIAGSLASRYGGTAHSDLYVGASGWRAVFCFAASKAAAGERRFHGLAPGGSAPTNIDPLTVAAPARIGMACAAATGNWSIVHGDGVAAPTVIGLGASFPVDVTTLYTLALENDDGGATVTATVRNVNTGATSTHTLSTNLPASFLAPVEWACNNATASSVAFDSVGTTVSHTVV